jgi:LPXTG-motif cell wall-anchored protein
MILTDALWGLLAGVVVALVVSAVLKWKKKKD